MTYTANPTTKQALELFSRFDTDTKLALLWYGYLDIKDELDPAPPNAVEVMGNALFDQIRALPKEEQLQAQRDMIDGAANEISHAYRAFDTSARMETWLLLGKGMEDGTIIQVPADYQLPAETKEFTKTISKLSMEERVNFMRSAVLSIV